MNPDRGARASVDVLVLGGGVIGLSCALAIHDRNASLSIGILDAPTSAMPASLAAAGMLAPWSEFPADSPLARLCAESLRLYPAFLETLPGDVGKSVELEGKGTLVPEIEEEEGRFARRLEMWSARGVPFRLLDGRALADAEPRLSRLLKRGAVLPESLVNPRRLHAAMKREGLRRGFVWIDDRGIEAVASHDRVVALRLEGGGRIEFETLLAATGAWTHDVASLLDLRFAVVPVKGQMLCLQAPEMLLRHVVHLRAFYLAQRAGFGVLVGSTMEEKGFDTTVGEDFVEEFKEHAASLVPQLAGAEVLDTWAGHRPRSSDGFPILGWSDQWQNLLVATGHFRNGILLTPITGRAVADLYEDRSCGDWDAFSPNRF